MNKPLKSLINLWKFVQASFKLKTATVRSQLKDKAWTLTLDPLSNWNLLYYESSGWHQMVGLPKSSHHDRYISNNPENIISGAQVISEFGLKPDEANDKVLANDIWFPFGNYGWRAFVFEEYLIVKSSSYYPHGNQTSWESQSCYYFKKAKNN